MLFLLFFGLVVSFVYINFELFIKLFFSIFIAWLMIAILSSVYFLFTYIIPQTKPKIAAQINNLKARSFKFWKKRPVPA